MFEAPSAQPGDSPPRPHGLQQTLSLSLSLLIYGSPSPCKKYRIYCNIRKYTKKYSIHIDIDIRYTYIYIQNKYIHTAYKPPRASNIHVKQCKHFAEDKFTKICWTSLHWETVNKAISMFLYVMDVLTKCQSLTHSHFVPNTKHWVAHGLLCRIYWRTIIPTCDSAIQYCTSLALIFVDISSSNTVSHQIKSKKGKKQHKLITPTLTKKKLIVFF